MKEVKVPVEVFTRCCGYFRPTFNFNKGKAEEAKERKPLKVPDNLIYRASTRNFSEKVTV